MQSNPAPGAGLPGADSLTRAEALAIPLHLNPFREEIMAAQGYPDDLREQVRRFARDGLLIVDFNLPEFERRAAEIVAQVTYEPKAVRRQDAWKTIPQVKALALAPEVLTLLERLYGRKPFAFQTLNFHVGTQQEIHSDTLHFSSQPFGFMAGVWFAFEDIDEGNGALAYYPGSHALPYVDLTALPGTRASHLSDPHKIAEQNAMSWLLKRMAEQAGLKQDLALVRKGQAVIWAANVYHGGSRITDPKRTRHSQVTHYFFEDCLYYTPLHTDSVAGRYYLRQPWDIARNAMRESTIHGRPARTVLAPRQILNRPIRSRVLKTLRRWLGPQR